MASSWTSCFPGALGRRLNKCFPNFEGSLPKAASRPFRHCFCLWNVDDLIPSMVLKFPGLTSIPLWLAMNPRNFPLLTSKSNLEGLKANIVHLYPGKSPLQVSSMVDTLPRFHQHVVNISLHCVTQHISRQSVHHPLVSRTDVNKLERHHCVLIDVITTSNEVRDTSFFAIIIWLYPEYASIKHSGSCPDVVSTSWSIRRRG